jgi:predicted RNase H-like HicB family nuclease
MTQMTPDATYLKFVRWSEEDGFYVGYCPDLFPWGGVCHSATEEETYTILCALVREEIEDLRAEGRELPLPQTRPMREALVA